MAEYEIWYADSLGNNRRMLSRWGGFRVGRRLNTIGQLHELLIPLDDAPAVLAFRDAHIEIWRDGELLLNTIWFVRKLGRTDKDGVRWLRVGGFDALYQLDSRVVAYASGSSEAVKTGAADNVLKAYVREQLGSLATDADRDRSTYITVADDATLGPTVYRSGARQRLWRLVQGICFESAQRGTPLYVDLVPQPNGTLELRTFPTALGMDHRRGGLGPVAISVDVGTLAASDWTQDWSDEHTLVYVGGRGLAAQREVVEVEDPARTGASPYGRREVWIDARNLSSTNALTSAGYGILWQGLPDERIVGVARAGFGVDWGYGDLVEASFGDEVADCRIDECEVTVDAQRQETVKVWLYQLSAEASLLTTAQQVGDIGVQESPEFTQTPTAYAVPQAGAAGTIAEGWMPVTIARSTAVAAEAAARIAADAAEAAARAAADTAESAARIVADSAEATARASADTAEATARATADSTHAALTTSAHGGIVASSDIRLTDSRTPTAHAASHQNGGSDEVATATPAANSIPKSGAGSTIADGWLSSAISRITSIGLTLPSILTVVGSPLTANGALSATLATQAANLAFAGPGSGAAAAPTFRALVAADLPATAVTAAAYGSATQVGTFTVDAQGRLTAAANVAIALAASAISSGEIPRSPLTTRGDLLTQNPAGSHTRLAIGAAGRYLRSDGTDPSWSTLLFADLVYAGLTTGQVPRATSSTAVAFGALDLANANAVTGLLAPANGGSGVNNGSFTLTWPASGTAALIGTAQTFVTGQVFTGNLTVTNTTQAQFDFKDTATGGTPSLGAWWRMFVDLVGGGGGDCTFGFYDVRHTAVRFGLTDGGAMLVGKTTGLTAAGDLDANGIVRGATFQIGTNQVVGARKTGWALPTGTLARTTFDQSTVTLAQLAQRVAAILTDLYSQHGLIGA